MGKRAIAQTVQEIPTLRSLTFGSLPYDTHPIDTYDGPQGWGPFYGPWTPWDFRDPAADISYVYGSGESNDWQFAPDYDVITLFADHSLDYVANSSWDVAAQNSEDEQRTSYTSTIANVVPQPAPSWLRRLRDSLQGQGE